VEVEGTAGVGETNGADGSADRGIVGEVERAWAVEGTEGSLAMRFS
jgi:hypothetical protein